jgi:acyl phosphate:glycerol-3-phosphate acyltransferase
MEWSGLLSPLAVLASYLLGSLSFAVIVTRAMGLADPRSYGSKNPGATNVLRQGNRAAALLTLAFDALKGFVPVFLALAFASRLGWGDWTVALVGLAAFLGHLWPVFFRFQGGKGVATAAGVLMGFDPVLGAAALASWVLIAAFSRYSSLASMVAAVFAAFFQALIWGIEPRFAVITLMALLLVWRHGENIQRLLKGTESKLGQKAGSAARPVVAKERKR